MGLKKAYDELTDNPEFSDGATLGGTLYAGYNRLVNIDRLTFNEPGSSEAFIVNEDSQGSVLRFVDGNNDTLFGINQGGPIELFSNTNLRLATGQSIEDGSGTGRIDFVGTVTQINDENGNRAFEASSDDYRRIHAQSQAPAVIYDAEGGFTAVQYTTDPSTGTLELTNANLSVPNDVTVGNTGVNSYYTLAVARKSDSGDNYKLQFNVTGTNNDEGYITHRNISTGNSVGRIRFDDGEVKASDSDGNTTILT